MAFVAHLDVLERLPDGRLLVRLPGPHIHELLHYYVGTRYFAELGYTGLYDAVVLADFEDAPLASAPGVPMRDLATNQPLPRGERMRAAADGVRAAFTPERWQAFKRDVGELRSATTPDIWQQATLDHGYNGTPLGTALLGAVARQPWIPMSALLRGIVLLDPLLFALCGALFWLWAGAAPAFAFLFFTFANPLNDHAFIGASYLRYVHLFALAAAALALRRGALAGAGVGLAVAGWLRIFPLALYGLLAIRDVAARDWRARLGSGLRLHVAFALATLAILAGTSLLAAPDGRNPWLAFAEKIRLHAGTPGINQVYLGSLLAYSPDVESLHASQVGDYWAEASARVRRDRAPLVLGLAALGLAFAAALARRVDRCAALVPGMLAIYCVFPMTHYYWTCLAVLPLALPDDRRIQRALLVLFAALGLCAAPGVLEEQRDLQFALESGLLLAFLVYCCVALWRSPTPERSTA